MAPELKSKISAASARSHTRKSNSHSSSLFPSGILKKLLLVFFTGWLYICDENRLAGATLIAPVVNYWWPRLPANLSAEVYSKQFLQDRWSLRVAHYLPWLTYWWNTQKMFLSLTIIARSPLVLSRQDRDLIPKFTAGRIAVEEGQVRQQGEYESVHCNLNIGFGTWEFDPMEIENPFPNNEGSVDLWMGDEDMIVPVTLQRYIVQQLPWIRYHELTGAGHLFPYADGISDAILKALRLGKY